MRALESAFGAPTIPPEIVGTLLNLAEFCEHDERPLPVEARTLGAIAERCRAYAKALHYKETEFVTSPAACVEAIIAINNRLQLPEAAMGVLVYAQAHLRLEIKEGWYEKLGQWENALDAHRRKAAAAESAARDAALEATASSAEIADARRKAGGDKELPGSLAASRGWSVGRRRGSQGGSEVTSGRDPRASTDQRSSVARKRLAARAGEAAAEARREATLGQMRCLAALAEWEALGRLCAREWDAGGKQEANGSLGSLEPVEPGSPESSSASHHQSPKMRSSADAAMRARMAPLATRAAWHLGDWQRMETYCASIPNLSGDQTLDQTHGQRDGYVSLGLARSTSEDGIANAGALAETEEDSVTSGLAGGGFARVDVAFFKAVLATRRGDAEGRARASASRASTSARSSQRWPRSPTTALTGGWCARSSSPSWRRFWSTPSSDASSRRANVRAGTTRTARDSPGASP